MKGTPIINGGQRTIQELGRISIKDLLEKNNLIVGETVEVFLKKIVNDEPCAAVIGKAHPNIKPTKTTSGVFR
jgi:hypothetical protein